MTPSVVTGDAASSYLLSPSESCFSSHPALNDFLANLLSASSSPCAVDIVSDKARSCEPGGDSWHSRRMSVYDDRSLDSRWSSDGSQKATIQRKELLSLALPRRDFEQRSHSNRTQPVYTKQALITKGRARASPDRIPREYLKKNLKFSLVPKSPPEMFDSSDEEPSVRVVREDYCHSPSSCDSRRDHASLPKSTKSSTEDAALGDALIKTIEMLSVRAALALSRPQPFSMCPSSTMHAVPEGMEFPPSSKRCIPHVLIEEPTPFQPTTEDSMVPKETESQTKLQSSPSNHTETAPSPQQIKLNHAMLSAVDRLSLQAALSLSSSMNSQTGR